MSLKVNLRHLEKRDLELAGELSPAELDLNTRDKMIRATQPLHYDLEVEMLDDSLLVQGSLQMMLDCQCVRCLKDFKFELEMNPWTLHLPLKPLDDEEAAPIKNDCVDLTPWVREDILLEFPQHPVCKPECAGIKPKAQKIAGEKPKPDVWAKLNKLKL